MKKMTWVLMFLISLPLVYAQQTSPFGQLRAVWEAVAQIIGLQFVTTSDQLAAVLRIFVFIIVYTLLHSVFKHSLGRAAEGETPILEQKALNVITIAISLLVGLLLPMEFLVKGSFVLLSILGAGILALAYFGLHGGTKDLSPGWAAFFRALSLLVMIWIVWRVAGVGEETTGITVGGVNLETLTTANQVLLTVTEIRQWILTALWVGFAINLIVWIGHAIAKPAGGFAAGYMQQPHQQARGWFARNIPTFSGGAFSGFFKAEKARQRIKELQTILLLISQNLTRRDSTELKKNADDFQSILANLSKLDYDALKRIIDLENLPTGVDTRLKKKIETLLKEEENVITALFALDLPQKINAWIKSIDTAREQISRDNIKDALKQAKPLVDVLERLNQETAAGAASI